MNRNPRVRYLSAEQSAIRLRQMRSEGGLPLSDRGEIYATRPTAPARGIPPDELDVLPADVRPDPEK